MTDESTRDSPITVAEQVFAESGIDWVSLREIDEAAMQKSTSEMHCHFGTKSGLIVDNLVDSMVGLLTAPVTNAAEQG